VKKRDRGRLIVLAVLLVFATVVPQVPHVEALGGLALNGSSSPAADGGEATGSAGTPTLGSATCVTSTTPLTTTGTSDVVLALLIENDTMTAVSSVTPVTDTAGLIWTFRASQGTPDNNARVFEYYAIAEVTLLSDQVTFTMQNSNAGLACAMFAFSGINTSAPFDTNAVIPVTNSATSDTTSATYTTSNPNDVLVYYFGECRTSVGQTNPAGFTDRGGFGLNRPSNCQADFLTALVSYKPVSAVQSATSYTSNAGESAPWALIGDAIQSAPAPLNASVITSSNVIDVGQSASFSCAGTGGIYPYTYSWTFGDGSAGSGASASHDYSTPGTVTVVCTVTDTLGTTAKGSTEVIVVTDPSITAFTASPGSLYPGDRVTFAVSTSGGYGALSYAYANLPPGCLSANSTSLSCYPTSSGNYRVTVTVTDRAMESANATAVLTVGPQRVLGLPQAVGLAVIFGAIVTISAVLILSVALILRRKKGRQAPTTA
jgi:hypothetical protein